MPSLEEMVFLEKEIRQVNGEIDQFLYSDDYLGNDEYIDLLLGCQAWRKNLDDNPSQVSLIMNMTQNQGALIYEYLIGEKDSQFTPSNVSIPRENMAEQDIMSIHTTPITTEVGNRGFEH